MSSHLRFETDGAELHRGAALPVLDQLIGGLGDTPAERAGARLSGIPVLLPILHAGGSIGRIAAGAIGLRCRPVRAVLFDKTAGTNWALGWHQDRTIVVRAQHETPGFGPWTVKQGLHHVMPPPTLLAGMVTLRVHLDDVPIDNAPLRIAAGTHRLGRIPVAEVAAAAERHPQHDCIATAGDIWLYATLILHASNRAMHPARRRVLQVDYSADDLPGGLEWLGIADPP